MNSADPDTGLLSAMFKILHQLEVSPPMKSTNVSVPILKDDMYYKDEAREKGVCCDF